MEVSGGCMDRLGKEIYGFLIESIDSKKLVR